VPRHHILSLIFLLCNGLMITAEARDNLSVRIEDGTEITVSRYAAKGERLLIWLPGEAGLQTGEFTAAERLAARGYEVWLADLFESRFLPVVPSSLDRIPAADVAGLIRHGQQQGKTVYLVSSGRGILPLLRGAHLWQRRHPGDHTLGGAILLSPKFFIETPDPGQAAKLLPIVSQTNLPLFILQPKLSPWFWKLDRTIPALQSSGSDVFVRYLPAVRDRFYFRPDASSKEQALAQRLPELIGQAVRLLAKLPEKSRRVAELDGQAPLIAEGKKARRLKPYEGDPTPPELRLLSLDGKRLDLRDYRGRVVLVNFWASWCPPCVHEMPSMQRLANKLAGQPFTILAVNMAEEAATIRAFLQTKVRVDFPILLDSDGSALKRWGVFAFPTSYVIDKQGLIRYALFGAVEWDTPEMLKKFRSLLNE